MTPAAHTIPNHVYQGRHILVMGLGAFGGGVGAVQFLARNGAHICVTDLRDAETLAESIAQIADLPNLELRLGEHREADFRSADLIVVNPAVPIENHFLQVARRAGIPLTSEMNLFWQHNPGRVLAVTGSNGKSTTTAMAHTILRAAGHRCWLGGNIGRSLLPVVNQIQPDDWVVLELSSFQLEDLDSLQPAPDIAVVTNLQPNHLDRHGSMDNYRLAKQTIIRHQTANQTAVLNQDDPDVKNWPTAARRISFGLNERRSLGVFAVAGQNAVVSMGAETQHWPIADWLQLPGAHNLQNALAATAATLAVGVDREAVRRGLIDYTPLPHRLQFVAEVADRRFYNDSLATTPESCIVALQAFDGPIVLLAGGYDKRVDLSAMAREMALRTRAVALMGQTGRMLQECLHHEIEGHATIAGSPVGNTESSSQSESLRSRRLPTVTQVCTSFVEAFQFAIAQSQPGDTILLSPGCASYDWFRSFVDRGDQFVRLVELHADVTNSAVNAQ